MAMRLSIGFMLLLEALTLRVDAAELKIASLAPEGSSWMQVMRQAAEIDQDEDGRARHPEVLRRRRHGQRQEGPAQDPCRAAGRQHLHARRVLPRSIPM